MQIFLAVICFIYTGYLKIEAEKVGYMNNLCHLLKCSSLSEYLKDKEKYQIRKPRNLESYAIFADDGVAKKLEEYEKEMELLESLQLKPQLVVEKDKDKNDSEDDEVLYEAVDDFLKKHLFWFLEECNEMNYHNQQ